MIYHTIFMLQFDNQGSLLNTHYTNTILLYPNNFEGSTYNLISSFTLNVKEQAFIHSGVIPPIPLRGSLPNTYVRLKHRMWSGCLLTSKARLVTCS